MKRKENGKFGIIYVMRLGENYKIGKASLTFTRLGEYTKLPEIPEYICVGVVLNTLCFENEMHELFKEKRIRGEWFALDNKDLNKLILYITARSIFRLDKDGIDIFNEEHGCEHEDVILNYLLRKSKIAYSFSKKYKWNRKYAESIIKQRKILIDRFKKYDDMQNLKMTFLFDKTNGIILKSQ